MINNRSLRNGTGQRYYDTVFSGSFKRTDSICYEDSFKDLDKYYLQENYQALANEIIITAARDYRDLYKQLYTFRFQGNIHCAKYDECEYNIFLLEKFFKSKYFSTLTQNDPDYIMTKLKKVAEDSVKEKIKRDAKYVCKVASKKTKGKEVTA